MHRAAEQASERELVGDPVDPRKRAGECSEPALIDGRLVQEGGAEVVHLAGERARVRRARIVENRGDLPAGDFIDVVADCPAVFARWDDGGLEPRAVGVCEEVVARFDTRVDGAFEPRGGTTLWRLRASLNGRTGQHGNRQPCYPEWRAAGERMSTDVSPRADGWLREGKSATAHCRIEGRQVGITFGQMPRRRTVPPSQRTVARLRRVRPCCSVPA